MDPEEKLAHDLLTKAMDHVEILCMTREFALTEEERELVALGIDAGIVATLKHLREGHDRA